jgi:hypothetical protein
MARFLVSVLVCAALGLASAPAVAAGGNSVDWVNSDAFSYSCIGITDHYPSLMYSRGRSLLTTLGFANNKNVIGHGFTRAAFLSDLAPEFAFYIHSHGDIYNSSSIQAAFLQDPPAGRCNDYRQDYISAAQVSAAAFPPYNVVIMSTCYLGSMYQPHTGPNHPNMMPEAFGIPKTRAYDGSRHFYMGYVYETYDSAAYAFEGHLLWFMQTYPGALLSAGWSYAENYGGYEAAGPNDPFVSAWYGDWAYAPQG